jgi:hypothetical protein
MRSLLAAQVWPCGTFERIHVMYIFEATWVPLLFAATIPPPGMYKFFDYENAWGQRIKREFKFGTLVLLRPRGFCALCARVGLCGRRWSFSCAGGHSSHPFSLLYVLLPFFSLLRAEYTFLEDE